MPSNALIDLITALWLGFIGACIGSFLNVVAYRMPLGMSIIWKPSHCPKCNHAIRPYDNVPIFGWLWLKGRCRDCQEPISPRYAIVEFVMGLAFFILAYTELFSGGANLPGGPITEFTGAVNNFLVPQWTLIWIYVCLSILLSLLMCAALIDLDGKRFPNLLVGFGLTVGLLMAITGPRTWIGVDKHTSQFTQVVLPLALVFWGIVCGLFAGALLTALWPGKISVKSKSSLRKDIVAIKSSKPYNQSGNVLVAFALIGFFLGYLFVCVAFVCTVVGLSVVRAISSKELRENSKIALPILWTVVIVLIAFWKPLEGFMPL